MSPITILGAGMAGFGAAHRCHSQGIRPVIFERKDHPGGHTASHSFPEGYTFDEGPHISYTKDERIKALFAESVGGDFISSKVYVNNYWKGQWIRHPAQVNLHGLPTELVLTILQEFIKLQGQPEPKVSNYQEWLYSSFGKTFADTFPMQYTRKYHTTDASNMSLDWLGQRVYRPNLEEVLRGALSSNAQDVHYVTEFRYPTRGGFVRYLDLFKKQADVVLDHVLVGIDPKQKVLRFQNGVAANYERLVSSIPLPELIPLIEDVPADVLAAANSLACSEAIIVTLGIDRADLTEAHWTYFYDADITTVRTSTPHMQSPNNVPPGCGCFQAEIYFSKKYKPRTRPAADYIDVVIADLKRCGLIRETDTVNFRHVLTIPYANVIFDLDRAAALAKVHGYLDDVGIAYCGRYGEWAYIWTDQSFMSGERAAQKALDRAVR